MIFDTLTTDKIRKTYKKFKAVDGVSVTVKAGGIYALIGKNGAGKTTLIRILAGLSNPDSGSVAINGDSGINRLCEWRKQMSFIVETPYFAPNLSAYDNMKAQCYLRGVGTEKIDGVLKTVELDNTANKKARDFSLGMRQRLGIGMAMIHEPSFIVLDEPTNGLDPAGIVYIRDLIKRLNREHGMTVIVSSHILAELSLIATDYIFMDSGKILDQLSNDELLKKRESYLSVKSSDNEKAAKLCGDKFSCRCEVKDEQLRIYTDLPDISVIPKIIVENGIALYHFERYRMTLEEYFLGLSGGAA